jgi:hypothetical protein
MFKRSAFLFVAFSAVVTAAEPAQEPVYIVLYSRFYDHSHQHTTDERLQRLLPMLHKLREKYPQSGISALLQFSGTVSEVMAEENAGVHLVDKVKDYASRGLVDIGYTGEEEPSYLYRPKPNPLHIDTPERRWTARADAAERFLTDFKNPVTGLPFAGLSGGLKRMLEVFGSAAFVTGIGTAVGGDSPAAHELRRIAPGAMMVGIPPANPKYGIEGFGFSAENFSRFVSPDQRESPEVLWEDNALRLSDVSLTDNKSHSTDEDLEALKKVFEKLDRSHARVIKLEVASYKEYLTKRADGSIAIDPLEWLYYHPDDPRIPPNMKPLVQQGDVERARARDEATLSWLLNDFLPANPGSRFISLHELSRMAVPASTEISSEQIRALASDVDERFKRTPMETPDFLQAGNSFFSLAESFEIFARALATIDKTGALPKQVKLTRVYGPLEIPEDNMGVTVASFTVRDVMRAATQIAPRIENEEWKPIPDNAVPYTFQAGAGKVNAAQLLRLMAQACLDPAADKILKTNAIQMFSRAAFMYPKNVPMWESSGWTFKPAILAPEPAAVLAASR